MCELTHLLIATCRLKEGALALDSVSDSSDSDMVRRGAFGRCMLRAAVGCFGCGCGADVACMPTCLHPSCLTHACCAVQDIVHVPASRKGKLPMPKAKVLA